jgi:hypothetical protein
MDDDVQMLHEALVLRDRLRLLASLQADYRDALAEHGFDQSLMEQLLVEWSRLAYPLTMRAVEQRRDGDSDLDRLLANLMSHAAVDAPTDDPSSVPPGEPWLKLVEDEEADSVPAPKDSGAEEPGDESRAA